MQRFSIVVPSYNYAHYVARAIDSVLADEGNDYEVIVIDDGSTDDTNAVVAAYGQRVRYIHQENAGTSAARNRGAREARGQFLLFLDADDRLLPEALPLLREFLDRQPEVDMLFGGHISVSRKGHRRVRLARRVSDRPAMNFRKFVNRRFRVVNGAAALRRTIFDRLQYREDCQQCEDLVFFGQVLALYRCASIPQPLVECHDHAGRKRRDLACNREEGTRIVEMLFDATVLDEEHMQWRDEFLTWRLLSLFDSHYRHGDYARANAYYAQAFRLQPRNRLLLRYLGRYVRSLWKGRATHDEPVAAGETR